MKREIGQFILVFHLINTDCFCVDIFEWVFFLAFLEFLCDHQ